MAWRIEHCGWLKTFSLNGENSGSGYTGMERKYFHLNAKLVIWFFVYFGAGNIGMHWSTLANYSLFQ
jgi:hypothetical protein